MMKLRGLVPLVAAYHNEKDGGEPPDSPFVVVASDNATPSAGFYKSSPFYILLKRVVQQEGQVRIEPHGKKDEPRERGSSLPVSR